MSTTPPTPNDARRERLAGFVAFVREHIRGDEKGEAQTYLDRLFRADRGDSACSHHPGRASGTPVSGKLWIRTDKPQR